MFGIEVFVNSDDDNFLSLLYCDTTFLCVSGNKAVYTICLEEVKFNNFQKMSLNLFSYLLIFCVIIANTAW